MEPLGQVQCPDVATGGERCLLNTFSSNQGDITHKRRDTRGYFGDNQLNQSQSFKENQSFQHKYCDAEWLHLYTVIEFHSSLFNRLIIEYYREKDIFDRHNDQSSQSICCSLCNLG